MIIALLAVLGVDLAVIVVLLLVLLARRRWVNSRPGAFTGAVRVVEGDVPGLSAKWNRGSGRWVSDVLVWTKAPLLLGQEVVKVDGVAGGVRVAGAGEVKRLGPEPVIVPLTVDGTARIEIAVRADDRGRAVGPWPADPDDPPTARHAASASG